MNAPKRRGRPPKARPQPTEEIVPTAAASDARRSEVLQQRRRRKVVGRNGDMKLSLPPHIEQDPNYRYYWALDKPGRIERLTQYDDYDFVVDDSVASDDRNTGGGKRIERHGGTDKWGNPQRHFLLRKPIEYHQEDEAEKLARRRKKMTAIERGKPQDKDGNDIAGDHTYVSKRGINVTQGAYQP